MRPTLSKYAARDCLPLCLINRCKSQAFSKSIYNLKSRLRLKYKIGGLGPKSQMVV